MALGMGFSMMQVWMKHWTKTALLTLLLAGCVEAPSTQIVYGPEVTKESVATELQKAIGPADSPALIRKEEAVLKETSRFIRGRPILDILNTSEVTVVERIETATQWQIKEVEKLQNFDLANPGIVPPPIVREDHKCWNKVSFAQEQCEIATTATALRKTPADSWLRPFSEFQQAAEPAEKTVTYHNLTKKTYLARPPEAVMNSLRCQDIPDCMIVVTEIEFDRVNWVDQPEGYKIHYRLKVSPDVPQLSRFLETCQQGSVQVLQPGQDPKQAPRFLVTFCETVRNYLPGQIP